MFKICKMCTTQYQKPIALKTRVCPVCKARNYFRCATEQEIQAETDRIADREAFIQQLLKED